MANGDPFRLEGMAEHLEHEQPHQSGNISPLALDNTGSESCTSRTGRSHLALFMPEPGTMEFQRYKKIWKGTEKLHTIDDLTYEIKSEVEEVLNIEKHDRSDWRGVASRLNIKARFIEKLIDNKPKNPCRKIFEQASNKKVKELLQVLYQLERHDVLDVIYKHIEKDERRDQYQRTKHPSQETTPESGSSYTSDFLPDGTPESPFKNESTCRNTPTSPARTKHLKAGDSFDSRKGSSSSGRSGFESNPQQHSDEYTGDYEKTTVDFHSEESKKFWKQIPPQRYSTTKEWQQFENTLKSDFPTESKKSQLLRFICYILKINNYDERHTKYIRDQDFANMVAWFGPIVHGKHGCLAKMEKLMKESVEYLDHIGAPGAHSFFAGYMSKEDADKAVAAYQSGTFLIRFSSTLAQEGSFVAVLKTPDGVEHHKIQGDPATGKVTFGGETCDDLTQLYKRRLCRGGVSVNGRTSCTDTCPNLPLNAMFKSYNAGPVPSRGRGRRRAQPQE